MRIERKLIVTRKDGIHAKSASEIVDGLRDYDCSVQFISKDKKLMQKYSSINRFSSKRGAEIHVILDGEDADDALVFIQWF